MKERARETRTPFSTDLVPFESNDFTNQVFVPNTHKLVHSGAVHVFGNDN